nr:ATP-binding cassette domain-containing protein [Desulfobulbaceae bacterium]
MSLYQLNKLRKEYGGREVLNISDLGIEKGKIYSLLGANGTGKSTLLNLLAFLDTPSSGEIYFDSRRVEFGQKKNEQLRRKVILLDQNPVLFSTTVFKNLEFGLKVRKVDKLERRDRIERALDTVGMQSFIHAPAACLSGGESQRVALARVLVLQPEVLLCDEPTSNVDKVNQAIIVDLLRELNSKQNISIIFSTHDHGIASSLAHRTIELEQGKILLTHT